ncbi:hypothetical protein Tco_1439182 [Tanacetum coccineum]
MADDDTPPPNPSPTSADKLIPFSITNKVLIKLDLQKHNYSSWSSFFIIYLGSLGLKSHVEEEASSSTTNPEWCKLDDLIKMWILGSLRDYLQEQVVTIPGGFPVNSLRDLITSLGTSVNVQIESKAI